MIENSEVKLRYVEVAISHALPEAVGHMYCFSAPPCHKTRKISIHLVFILTGNSNALGYILTEVNQGI
jgi:hypothetical protein